MNITRTAYTQVRSRPQSPNTEKASAPQQEEPADGFSRLQFGALTFGGAAVGGLIGHAATKLPGMAGNVAGVVIGAAGGATALGGAAMLLMSKTGDAHSGSLSGLMFGGGAGAIAGGIAGGMLGTSGLGIASTVGCAAIGLLVGGAVASSTIDQ